ncbi:MAG: TonB-dependent receptor [Candidatus Eisenbacteria bacterium]|nr:TonB-dependent receptor [Candidatus Eisenbacteria bacterium]
MVTRHVAACAVLLASLRGPLAQEVGAIQGRAVDEVSKQPMVGANVLIVGLDSGTFTGTNGEFMLSDLPMGTYSVQIDYVGCERLRIEGITLTDSRPVAHIYAELELKPIPLGAITVTPGRFAIMGSETEGRQTLTRSDIQKISQVGDDIYRAITRLPGIGGNDFSAKFTVRGGENEEVLVLLDGLELYEPFHVKDVNGGVLSIIDVGAIEGIDLITGGFSAEYGDRTSGVLNITSRTAPAGTRRAGVGISFMNARLMLEGSTERASWLLSARRGYLDLVLELMREENKPSPTYYDLLGLYRYRIGDTHTISAHVLTSDDRIEFVEDDEDQSSTSYGNSYAWISLRSLLSPRLLVKSLVSGGKVTRDREGVGYQGDTQESGIDFDVADERGFDVVGLKQDWSFEASDNMLVKWGVDIKRLSADYDYFSRKVRYVWDPEVEQWTSLVDTTRIDRSVSGERWGAYLANRVRPLGSLAVEVGARFDHASYTGDDLFSPRIGLAYTLGKHTVARAGWGYFYQSESMNALDIQDGDETFDSAELAKHSVIGFERSLANGILVRLEGYHKAYSDLRPEYRNWMNQIEFFPEMQDDRVRVHLDGATVKGIEVYLKRDTGGRFSWWGSYGLSYADDDLTRISVAGEEMEWNARVPGKFDQRHTVYLDLNYRPDPKWHLNLAWQYHTGWPYTAEKMGIGTLADGSTYAYEYVDEAYGATLPAFHRLDARLNRVFKTSIGTISTFLEIINLYNHENVRTYDTWIWSDGSGNYRQIREAEYWFKLLPSIGLSWSWNL